MLFSYSKINTYEGCKFKYYSFYILKKNKEKRKGNIHTWLGNAVHEVLENGYYETNGKHKLLSKDYLLYILEKNKFYDKLNTEYKELAKNIIINYQKKHKTQRLEGLITEKTAKLPLASYATLMGNIDKIYTVKDTVYVIDYKTSKDTKYIKQPKENLQLKIYDLIAKSLYPDKEIKVMLDFIRIDQQMTYSFTEKEREENREEIINKIDEIINFEIQVKKNLTLPTKTETFLCNYCPLCKGETNLTGI